MDISALTDEELDGLRRDVLIEQERRRRLDETPAQVAALAKEFLSGGGSLDALTEAVNNPESVIDSVELP